MFQRIFPGSTKTIVEFKDFQPAMLVVVVEVVGPAGTGGRLSPQAEETQGHRVRQIKVRKRNKN